MTDGTVGAPKCGGADDPRTADLPAELGAALASSDLALGRFLELSPSHRREYVRWVSDARRSDTRARRAAQAVMRLLEQGGRDRG